MNIISNKGLLGFYDTYDNFIVSIPIGQYTIVNDVDKILLSYTNFNIRYEFYLDLNTNIDGLEVTDIEDLITKLSSFSVGGGDGDGVTWDDVSNISDPDKIVQYSGTGHVNTAIAEFPENAVPLVQLDVRLESKVDKVEGKVLSSNDFTNIEKEKLASVPTTFTIPGLNQVVQTNAYSNQSFFLSFSNKGRIGFENMEDGLLTLSSDLNNNSGMLAFDGQQWQMSTNVENQSNSVLNINGRISAQSPIDIEDLTNKGYVDSNLMNIQNLITMLQNGNSEQINAIKLLLA